MNVTTVTIQGCHSQMRYTPTLFQYDYGQILKIEGVELPETFQAHFCNVSDSSTKTVLGSDNQVSIPDEYLDTGEDILCYIYLHTGEEDGETEYKIFIPVTARQSITDEEPTPEEQSVIDQLVSALNSGVARAETAATNAETSEANAKTSEDNAKESELAAKASEEAALQAKDDAETAKTEAEEAEANATQKATNAEGSANRASASATLSQSWAVGGTGTRQGEDTNNAKYYAESTISAKDAAVLAKTQAESARDLAVQAKDSAQASAQTATTKASEATQSATSASQSASSASASSASASQSAALATSAKTAAETAQGLAEDARDDAVTAKDDAETAQQEAESAAQSIAQSAQQIETNTQDISDLKSALEDVTDTESYTGYTEITEVPEWQTGFLEPSNGRIYTGGTYDGYQAMSASVSVQEGDTIELLKDGNVSQMRTVCAYANGSVVSSKGASNAVSVFTVPSGIDAIGVCCISSTAAKTIRITRQGAAYATNIKRIPVGYMQETGNISPGESLELPYNDAKAGNVVTFSARITEFSSIKIGKNIGQYPYLTVDDTNLVLFNNSNTPTVTVAHGLTIANDIQIALYGNDGASIKRVEIVSQGNEYIYTTPFFFDVSLGGAWYATSIGSTLTGCVLSWTNRKINAPIWIIGDSYIGFVSTRWPYYLNRDGLNNSVMFCGYAGAGSSSEYVSLKNLLQICVPKIVVWTLGMNNADSSSAVNASWKLYYDRVVSLSKQYGFELVLYTVPTCPAVNNNYKNAIVRASGYRFVDADGAVRIPDSTSWITGTLSTDNTHPTAKGANLIYHRFIADLPELAFYANIPDS